MHFVKMDHVKFNCCTLFLIVSVCILKINKAHAQDFGYDGERGPTHWGEQYNTCSGKHQSPINIDSVEVTHTSMSPLKMTGFDEPALKTTITNNGHTVMVTMDSEVQPQISGGPLQGTYEFAQLHFHWGDNDTYGSEDTLDGKSFSMELHIVFFKKVYRNSRSAMDFKDGLTVLAIFYELSEEDNPVYSEFVSRLSDVRTPKHQVDFEKPPTLRELLPEDIVHYYTYNGSLTTPPCSEVVTWIDFKEPVQLSHEQLEMFRELENEEGNALTHNFRPIQPLGDRIVLFNVNEEELSPSEVEQPPPVVPMKDDDLSKDLYNVETPMDNGLPSTVKPTVGSKNKKNARGGCNSRHTVNALSFISMLLVFIYSIL